MAVQGLENLSVLRITKIVQALQDEREKAPRRLRWLSRTNRVPSARAEMMARFVGRVLIADLIALDSSAAVYSSGKLNFESVELPKLKIGRMLTESQLDQFEEIRDGRIQGDNAVLDFISPIVNNALDGIDQRIETLLTGLMRDRIDYDRLGYKASGALWGMPTDLKVTTATPWTTAASATPFDDILAILLLARVRYGIEFNRLTMSTQAFRYAIATAEFQAKAKLYLPQALAIGTNYSTLALPTMRQMAQSILGQASDGGFEVTIELNDDRYWYQNTDGSLGSARYQPINEVILDDSRNDNNNAVRDVAAGPVVEAMFLGMSPASVIGGSASPLNRRQKGPISYMTFPTDLNPPNITLWGVDCAWPRRNLLQQSADLNVGAFGDTIAVGEPF